MIIVRACIIILRVPYPVSQFASEILREQSGQCFFRKAGLVGKLVMKEVQIEWLDWLELAGGKLDLVVG